MKLLALDSTAVVGSVALCEDKECIAEYFINNGNTHSESILPMIEHALKTAGWEIDDIDVFAVSQGPGSFTGVRIGVATIKGLAFGKNKNCIGVSTLEALAYNLKDLNGLIVPVMNARRNQVYTALFQAENGKLTRLTEDDAISVEELDALLKDKQSPIYLVGDGYELCKEQLQTKTENTPTRLIPQSAYSVCQVARKMALNGYTGDDINLKATYLRLPQAERERNERLQQQGEKS